MNDNYHTDIMPIEAVYLREDIEQIKRYFPGAEPVQLHTPFDLTPRPMTKPIKLDEADDFELPSPHGSMLVWPV